MKNKIYKFSIIMFSLLIFFSCQTKQDEDHSNEEESHVHEEDGPTHEEDTQNEEPLSNLLLTKDQAQTVGLEFGSFSDIKVNDFIKATGTLGLPPNAYSSVSAKANGIITGTKKYVEGNSIKKGQVIAFIENPDFIIKQQEYLEAVAQLKFKRLDLERQQTLVNANAGVNKNLQQVSSEVSILEAKTISLKKQLNYLGISTENLNPDKITNRIAIIAPMSGFISAIKMHNGMYVQPSESLMEIIASNHLHLELDIFEKDISEIKVGQKISYSVPALGNTPYEGEVSVIGKEFDLASKTVRVHGHLHGKKPVFLKDLFINAKIWLNNQATQALPEGAIIMEDGNSVIYITDGTLNNNEYTFQKIDIVPGASLNGFTSIKTIDTIPEGMQIVTKGAYFIYAQSKKGELTHEH